MWGRCTRSFGSVACRSVAPLSLPHALGPARVSAPYFVDSFRHTPDGWKLAFDPRDMVASQARLNGDHWDDWTASNCPALLIRGRDSKVTTAAHGCAAPKYNADYAERRPRFACRQPCWICRGGEGILDTLLICRSGRMITAQFLKLVIA